MTTALARRPTVVVAAGAGVAALGLLLWQLSPARSLLAHDVGRGAAWFTLSWLLMTVATMLPTSLPLLRAFARLLGGRRDAGRLVATVVVAYLAVWTLAGVMLAVLNGGAHALVGRTHHGWVLLPLTLLLAGLYQLSGTSARCLRACRSPFSFLARRWSGRRPPAAEAALVGVDYGISCLGCCAALMLVMFAVGMSSPLLMIGLGGVAALHKHASWGESLARVTGVALVLVAAAIAWSHAGGAH